MSQADKKIDLATAISWTQEFRDNNPKSSRAFLVSVQAINSLLAEMGNPTNPDICVRVYVGKDPNSKEEKLILVGTEEDRSGVYKDLLPGASETSAAHNIYDFTKPCPPFCDPTSPLN